MGRQSSIGLLLALVGAAPEPALALECRESAAETARYVEWSEPQHPLGVALLVHGLNASPASLQPLVGALNEMGIETLRLTLAGHTQPISWRGASAERWLQQVVCGWRLARNRAEERGVPLFFAGHSLGGLLGALLIGNGAEVERVVLLAPALRVRKVARLLSLVSWWRKLNIPSAAPAVYRVHDGTPVNAYLELTSLLERLDGIDPRALDRPTLVLVDRKDELVDATGLFDLVRDWQLHRWSGAWLNKSEGAHGPHHLILGPSWVGAATWEAMVERIRKHLLD